MNWSEYSAKEEAALRAQTNETDRNDTLPPADFNIDDQALPFPILHNLIEVLSEFGATDAARGIAKSVSKLSSYANMAKKIRPLQAAPKVWNYLKFRTQKRHAIVTASRSTPQIAALLLTKRCNLSCDFCNVASFLHDKKTKWRNLEGDLERVKKLFENPLFANCLLVDILGGEPLMVKELVPIVAFLTERGHLTNITTNGMHLLPRIAELRDAGISRISVSIYEENRAILERDLAKINAIFPVNTSLILFRKDIEDAPDMLIERVRFVRDLGCLDVRSGCTGRSGRTQRG